MRGSFVSVRKHSAAGSATESAALSADRKPFRELSLLCAAWLALAILLTLLASRDISAPGLYYDEALFAGFAKDFVKGSASPHIPSSLVVSLFGRPLPILIQSYLGGLKSWMLIPSFAVFGSSVTVLRMTDLFWSLLGLLFFMLLARKLLGLPAALVAAAILAADPSFYFLSVLDWGPFTPTFLCRVAGFYFFLSWTQGRRWRDGVLAGILLGLGVFNKIDFALILLGCGIALGLSYRQAVLEVLRNARRQIAVCGLAFLVAASPMALLLFDLFGEAAQTAGQGDESTVKLNTLRAMYDGSYLFRLMRVGGNFDRMFADPSPVWSPFGLAVIVASVLLAVRAFCVKGATREGRLASFLLLSLALITMGVFLLPSAVRMHHSTLVYPFPHLIVAAAVVMLWTTSPASSLVKVCLRGSAAVLVCLVLAGHFNALRQTQALIEATGGRGLWSNSIETFCNEIKGQSDVSIVSLDWGFNEQLSFLTDDKQLSEPFWNEQPVSLSESAIYLVHPGQYAVIPQGVGILDYAQRNPERFAVRPYSDRQGNAAFYAIRCLPRKQ